MPSLRRRCNARRKPRPGQPDRCCYRWAVGGSDRCRWHAGPQDRNCDPITVYVEANAATHAAVARDIEAAFLRRGYRNPFGRT